MKARKSEKRSGHHLLLLKISLLQLKIKGKFKWKPFSFILINPISWAEVFDELVNSHFTALNTGWVFGPMECYVTFVSAIFTDPFNCFENVCIRFCEVSFYRAPSHCRGFYCSCNQIQMANSRSLANKRSHVICLEPDDFEYGCPLVKSGHTQR